MLTTTDETPTECANEYDLEIREEAEDISFWAVPNITFRQLIGGR